MEVSGADPFMDQLLSYFAKQGSRPAAPISHPDSTTNEMVNNHGASRDYRQAAVLIPIVRPTLSQASSIIFTVRTESLRSHAGQVSFPGGTVDAGDRDPIHTALRESEEEIGLTADSVEILGQLGEILLPSGFCVTPVVGLVQPGVVFRPSPREVANIFQVPISLVLNPTQFQRKLINWQDIERHVFELQFEEYRIWGATATILHHLGTELQGSL